LKILRYHALRIFDANKMSKRLRIDLRRTVRCKFIEKKKRPRPKFRKKLSSRSNEFEENAVLFHSNQQGVWRATHFAYSAFWQPPKFCVTPQEIRHLNWKFCLFCSFRRFGAYMTTWRFNKGRWRVTPTKFDRQGGAWHVTDNLNEKVQCYPTMILSSKQWMKDMSKKSHKPKWAVNDEADATKWRDRVWWHRVILADWSRSPVSSRISLDDSGSVAHARFGHRRAESAPIEYVLNELWFTKSFYWTCHLNDGMLGLTCNWCVRNCQPARDLEERI
jgi:hypothetical protein